MRVVTGADSAANLDVVESINGLDDYYFDYLTKALQTTTLDPAGTIFTLTIKYKNTITL